MQLTKKLVSVILITALLLVPVSAATCSEWFYPELSALTDCGLLPIDLAESDLTQPISRLETCRILVSFWMAVGESIPYYYSADFLDTQDDAVMICSSLGLVSGYGNGLFGPQDTLTRQQMFCILFRLLKELGYSVSANDSQLRSFSDRFVVADWAWEATALMLDRGIVVGSDGFLNPEQFLTREQALAMVWRVWQQTDQETDSPSIAGDIVSDEFVEAVSSPAPGESNVPSEKDLTSSTEPYEEKYTRIFGSMDAPMYRSESEAKAHMVTLTVPVWNFNTDHVKVQTSRTFEVHEAIADTVLAIFTEIFNGEERFPIYSIGGFSWRGDGTSEHNWGIAIDINPDENYYVYHGVPTTGSHWTPGEDPYSIPPDGDVVRAFARYGFAWGGNAWQYTQDYMHFSYFGG